MDDEKILWRVALLAVFAVVADLWLRRHVGFGLENPIRLLGYAGSLTLFSGVLDWAIDKKQKEAYFKPLRLWIRRTILATPTLAALYVVGPIFSLMYSSVIVLAPGNGSAVVVSVSGVDAEEPEAKKRLAKGVKSVRLLRPANPFGRDLRLSVSGYVSRIITVYPLTGVTIDPSRDLQRLPSLLFRPAYNAFPSLKAGGKIEVHVVGTDADGGATCRMIAEAIGGDPVRAFSVGPSRPTPARSEAIWTLELQSSSFDAQQQAEARLAWIRPTRIATKVLPKPGDRLYVVIKTKVNKPKASIVINVGQQVFQDHLVAGKAADPPKCEKQ